VSDLAELISSIRPVDVAAFRNLIDSAEEYYLRSNLPKDEFRTLQRLRLRAAQEYVDQTKHNCGILLRLGESACHNRNSQVSAAALDVVAGALRLWMNVLIAAGALDAGLVLLEAHVAIRRVIDVYENLTNRVVRLKQLQHLT